MGTHTIENVVATRDAEDRLTWRARVATDAFGIAMVRAFFLHWDGVAAFYKEPMPSGTQRTGVPRLTLPARWMNRSQASRVLIPRETVFEFATEVSPRALDRIEQFRESGRLYTRIEGSLTWVHALSEDGDILRGIARLVGDPSTAPAIDVFTEAQELTRDRWGELLAILRPPGIIPIEIRLPQIESDAESIRRALVHLDTAQIAFDEGRYDAVAQSSYRALDEIKAHAEIKISKGDFFANRLLDQRKALAGICNPDRHGEMPSGPQGTLDRTLAQHVLAAAKSLTAVLARY